MTEEIWHVIEDKTNLVLIIWSVFLLISMWLSGNTRQNDFIRKQHLPVPIYRTFTRAELKEFDGQSSDSNSLKPIYLALEGRVYDVSPSRKFYGPDGPYSVFAGKDCTIMLAKQSFDPNDTTPLNQLKPSEKMNLDDWKAQFNSKYVCIGELID